MYGALLLDTGFLWEYSLYRHYHIPIIMTYKKSIDAKHQRASKQEMQQVKMN
jgi:hypothetical protein